MNIVVISNQKLRDEKIIHIRIPDGALLTFTILGRPPHAGFLSPSRQAARAGGGRNRKNRAGRA
jgi:hypothetical protein